MAYWIMKSEPSSYSWDDLVRDGGTEWDGVRNNAARLHLRAMVPGDQAFFYASMTDKAIVGIMKVTRGPQPDPKDNDWVSVRVEPVRPLTPVTLKAIKDEPKLKHRWNEAHEVGHSIIPWHKAYLHGDRARVPPAAGDSGLGHP